MRHARALGLSGKKLPWLLRANEVLSSFEAGREIAVRSADIRQQIRFELRKYPGRHFERLRPSLFAFAQRREHSTVSSIVRRPGSYIVGAALHSFDLSDWR
jgi:hypothetical protein